MRDKIPESMYPSRRYIISIFVIILIGAIVRFRNLGGPSLWLDELMYLNWSWFGEKTWEGAMENWGYSFGMEQWIYFNWFKIAGTSDWGFRSLSAISGTLLIFVVSEISRELKDEKTGVVSAALISSSLFLVEYSQEGRHYMLTTLMLWSTFLLVIKMNGSVKLRILAAIMITMAWSVSYTNALVITCVFISLLIWWKASGKQKQTISKENDSLWMLCILSSLALFSLPIITRDFGGAGSQLGWVGSPPTFSEALVDGSEILFSESVFSEVLIGLIIFSPVILALNYRGESFSEFSKKPEFFLYLAGITSFSSIVLISTNIQSLFVDRYLLIQSPIWIIIASISLCRVIDYSMNTWDDKLSGEKEWSVAILLCSLFISGGLVQITHISRDPYRTNTDFEGMAEDLHEFQIGENSFVISHPGAYNWENYIFRHHDSNNWQLIDHSGWWPQIPSEMYDLVNTSNPDELVYLVGHFQIDQNFISFLETKYNLSNELVYVGGRIVIFEKGGI